MKGFENMTEAEALQKFGRKSHPLAAIEPYQVIGLGKPAPTVTLPKPNYGAELLSQCQVVGLPLPVLEHRFDPVRRWRFDLAWPDRLLAVEIEGGIWTKGRHSRGKGFEADAEKYNAATLAGWRLLRFSTDSVKDGSALTTIELALERFVAQAHD